jgi:hypothetical protein
MSINYLPEEYRDMQIEKAIKRFELKEFIRRLFLRKIETYPDKGKLGFPFMKYVRSQFKFEDWYCLFVIFPFVWLWQKLKRLRVVILRAFYDAGHLEYTPGLRQNSETYDS